MCLKDPKIMLSALLPASCSSSATADLTGLLSCFLAFLLSCFLAFLLSCFLAFLLSCFLAFFFSFFLHVVFEWLTEIHSTLQQRQVGPPVVVHAGEDARQ